MALLLGALVFSGCGRSSAPGDAATAGNSNSSVRFYMVCGVVKDLPADGKTAVIRHEAVPDLMPAMTMPFEVRDTSQLRGLKAGDQVEFQLAVGHDDAWITRIRLTNAPSITNPSTAGVADEPRRRRAAIRLVRDVDPLAIGDALPEYHFTNELGRAVSTREFLGQPFAMTFFFTRCPFPNFCPKLSSNFSDAQNNLRTNALAPARWHLFSITFDTETDTPAELLSYARHYSYDPSRWSFLTGDLTEITALADQVGEEFGHDETGGITHKLRTVVVDAGGHVRKIWTNNDWTGDDLAREIIRDAN